MADYLVTCTRTIRVEDDVTEAQLRKELMATLRDVHGDYCRTLNYLRYQPVGRIDLSVAPARRKRTR